LHWLLFEQKQPLGLEHSLDAPLHAPSDVQEKPVAVEFGQPPSGHGIAASPASVEAFPSALPPASAAASPAATSAAPSFRAPSVPPPSVLTPLSESAALCVPSGPEPSDSTVTSSDCASPVLASQGSEHTA
jgi:hypothetical protein